MKKLIVLLFVVALVLSFGVQTTFAQAGAGAVVGKAVRWNGDPIANATIRALAGPLETAQEISRTTTGADGSYALSVPVGTPYWIHIDTYGSWWGYSYQVPFTLRPSERISDVYFALGPRDVHEIVLPAPVSSLAPATGANKGPTIQDFANLNLKAAAPAPAAPAAEKPVSNVKPAVGYNDVAQAPAKAAPKATAKKPVSNVKPAVGFNNTAQAAPKVLPQTGRAGDEFLALMCAAALVLLAGGLGARRLPTLRRS